eukprot:1902389-Alexandrium_andersonii.AAC.1
MARFVVRLTTRLPLMSKWTSFAGLRKGAHGQERALRRPYLELNPAAALLLREQAQLGLPQ